MRVAGRPSWRFGSGNGQCWHLLAALFARDSAGLVVAPSPDVPPPLAAEWLAGELPSGLAAIAPADLAVAAGQWLEWWRALVASTVAEAGSRPPADAEPAEVLAWLANRHATVFDPPEFGSLATMPELRAVARAAQQTHPRVPDRSGSFDYQLIRSIAEQTAADFGVPIDGIDGTAHVLDVQGLWWHVAGPGCVLCSPQATADPAVAAQLLRAVFASRLA
ncbi:MAG: hypothetical protein WBH47_08705 [Streptosporangiaceae bacterium]